MIQMIVNQTVPKMLNQSQKVKPKQKPLQKKLNHLQNQMILTQMTMKKKAKQVKSQQKNNKM